MGNQITVPDMGESVIEATVGRWLKQEGEAVKAGEPVVELETDKINLEVGAQQAGVLQKIVKAAGETVAVGDVLGLVQTGEPASAPPASDAIAGGEAGAKAELPAQADAPSDSPSASSERIITPLARRMAQELGVNLAQVQPSGAGGRITKEDVQAFAKQASDGQSPAAPAPAQPAPVQPTPAQPADEKQASQLVVTSPTSALAPSLGGSAETRPQERVRLSRRRQTIARRLVEAQHSAAMLTTFNEIDMSAVIDLRKRRREGFKEQYGVDLGFMPFFIKASVGALKAFPRVNSELQGEELLLKGYYDIGIAVGAEEGLVVPVVRNADHLSFAELEKTIRAYVTKSRENTLALDDLRGGTFTITNGGVYGSLLSTPILNPPQVAILGMHAIKERAMVLNGQIVARPMMYVALSYDHRVVDGREAVQFLVRLKELVEDPEALLFA